MTPKEKAKELFRKYLSEVGSICMHESYCDNKNCKYEGRTICSIDIATAKKCALIAVDEMLLLRYLLKKETWFYKEVKKEIEKL